MAAPPTMTTLDMSGQFFMNKTLSDDTDEILRLQGISWWTRQAIKLATVYITTKHYKDDTDVEHIDINQVLTGGAGASDEYRILDWQERETDNSLFGPVVSRSRRSNVADVEDAFLKDGWSPDTAEHGAINTVAQSDTSKSGKIWSSEQTWGFEDVGGEKRYTRHVRFVGPDGNNVIYARLVYDYVGPLV